jgi:hypothetical protein
MLRLIKSTETMEVDHPVMLIYSDQPGVGRTSLGYMARRVVNLDFDKGSHRSGNRGDTIQVDHWNDVEELLNVGFGQYETIIPDTVGRCLDLMSLKIMEDNPKMGYNGNLSKQGWGELKTRWRLFISRLQSLGKDVVLLAHGRADKEGELSVMRPDIQGGTYSEIMKCADFVGYMYMLDGKHRGIDFSPSDTHVGKNPGQWPVIKVPEYGKDAEFLSKLVDDARSALGRISEASASIASGIADWTAKIETLSTPDELNEVLPKVQEITPVIFREQVKRALLKHADKTLMKYDKDTKAFVKADA